MGGLLAQRAVAITDILAETGNRKATLRTTTSLIKMTSYALIAWSVYQSTPFSIVLTAELVRAPPTLNPVSFGTVMPNPPGLVWYGRATVLLFFGLYIDTHIWCLWRYNICAW